MLLLLCRCINSCRPQCRKAPRDRCARESRPRALRRAPNDGSSLVARLLLGFVWRPMF